ncbi:MAG: hypothetical protein ACOCRO_05980 [Halanaerobiales bacterium]
MKNIKALLEEQGYLTWEQIKKYSEENNLDYKLVYRILVDIGVNFIHIKPGDKYDESEEDFEKCVICSKITNVKKSEKIEYRNHYVRGVGQLCSNCYNKY